MKIFIGIDNGLSGGITVLNEEQKILKSIVMPIIKINKKTQYIVKDIVAFLKWCNVDRGDTSQVYCCLEKAHVRPVSGKRACFMNGYGYGLMQGILESAGISYEIVSPQAWLKELGIVSKDTKGSIPFCQRKWPEHDWTATERSSKSHDGKTDSACIALHCYRRNR